MTHQEKEIDEKEGQYKFEADKRNGGMPVFILFEAS
jgi:hypothetical protein